VPRDVAKLNVGRRLKRRVQRPHAKGSAPAGPRESRRGRRSEDPPAPSTPCRRARPSGAGRYSSTRWTRASAGIRPLWLCSEPANRRAAREQHRQGGIRRSRRSHQARNPGIERRRQPLCRS
jgi:hypothetical protein